MSITALLNNISKPVQLSDAGNTIKKQLQQLSQDLKTGDLAAAQKDYATVQQNLKKAVGTPVPNQLINPQHHYGNGGTSSSQTSLLQEINQLGQSLTSNDLSGAQQAYSTLQQQLQQTSLGSQSSSNSSVSMVA